MASDLLWVASDRCGVVGIVDSCVGVGGVGSFWRGWPLVGGRWWLVLFSVGLWVAVAVGDCRCCGFGVTMLDLVEYPDLGRQN